MITRKILFRFLLAVLVLAIVISCSILPELGGNSTEVLKTMQAYASHVNGLGLDATAATYMTQEGSKLLSTVQAVVTEHRDEWIATAGAFTTEQGSKLIATAEAYSTQEDIKATIAALVTQARGLLAGTVPDDIPIMGAQTENLTQSSGMVSFTTSTDLPTVLEYYKNQMPANGWEKVEQGSLESEYSAVLNYIKGDRAASVTINRNPSGGTIVAIILTRR